MFQRLFVEKAIANQARTKKIINNFKHLPIIEIDNYQDVFEKVRKPYLLKRSQLDLFLAHKKGSLVKQTPPAYGVKNEPHYYFIHQYNCVYECDYCYLQGYFRSPDIVLFLNYEEIISEIDKVVKNHQNQKIWFHAGEFSDSLALSNLTNEWPLYFNYFKNNPNAFLEIRTKAININPIKNLQPSKNIVISFSLSTEPQAKNHDIKTPSVRNRINAIEKLANLGFKIGVHFDPIIYSQDWQKDFMSVCHKLFKNINPSSIEYISIGVIRFSKSAYKCYKTNYPNSNFHTQEINISNNNQIKYHQEMRFKLLKFAEEVLAKYLPKDRVYRCMEE